MKTLKKVAVALIFIPWMAFAVIGLCLSPVAIVWKFAVEFQDMFFFAIDKFLDKKENGEKDA